MLTRMLAAACLMVLLPAVVLQAEPAGVTVMKPADKWELVLEKFLDEKHDLVVTVFSREGKPTYAYAQAPLVSQALHRVDVTPAAPIEYIIDGKRFDPPDNIKGDYDNKNEKLLA